MALQQAHSTEQTGLKKRLFTIEEYERMIEAGVFGEDERIELIRGEIIEMPPIGFDHGNSVSNLVIALTPQIGKSARPWIQSPIQLPNNTLPEPDFALLKPGDYGKQRPVLPSDVILIVEVSDTTLKSDRDAKGHLYAQVGIPEYWIVNLVEQVIEVYTKPRGGSYKQVKQASRGDKLSLPAQLGTVEVSDILVEKKAKQ